MRLPWRVNDSWIAVERAVRDDGDVGRPFADEVDIDFPSVVPAVERMRQPFVDPDVSVPLVARITLSPHQAHAGAAVPVEVPVRVNCRSCGGRGEVWSEPCRPCGGSGHSCSRHWLTVSVPAGVADGDGFTFSVTPPRGPRTRVDVRVAVT
ncbi:MAG: hypothetical protein AB1635_09370 [Acidobacteriota bacterium]